MNKFTEDDRVRMIYPPGTGWTGSVTKIEGENIVISFDDKSFNDDDKRWLATDFDYADR